MSELTDLLGTSDYVWQRHRDRMAGLTDAEYGWEPVPDCRTVRAIGDGTFRSDGPAAKGDPRVFTTLSWRLAHIADLLAEERNAVWLGVPTGPPLPPGDAGTATDALGRGDTAYASWRAVLAAATDLDAPIGSVAGPYGDASRRTLVLHILDELIHHSAETALLRDLYLARSGE
jgi:hypothetical protein